MLSKKSFTLFVVSKDNAVFAVVQIIYFRDCSSNSAEGNGVGMINKKPKRLENSQLLRKT